MPICNKRAEKGFCWPVRNIQWLIKHETLMNGDIELTRKINALKRGEVHERDRFMSFEV